MCHGLLHFWKFMPKSFFLRSKAKLKVQFLFSFFLDACFHLPATLLQATLHTSGPRWLFVGLSSRSGGWAGVAGDRRLSRRSHGCPNGHSCISGPVSDDRQARYQTGLALCQLAWVPGSLSELAWFTHRGLPSGSAEVPFAGRYRLGSWAFLLLCITPLTEEWYWFIPLVLDAG